MARDRRSLLDLERIDPSPLHALNQAVAVAEWQGAEAALSVLQEREPASGLAKSCLSDAVLGDLYRSAGNLDLARRHGDFAQTTCAASGLGRTRITFAMIQRVDASR